MTEQKEQIGIPYPPPEVFKTKRGMTDVTDTLVAQQQPLALIEKIEAPQSGGILVYHKGIPYPQKGWPTPHALEALYMPKRGLVTALTALTTKDLLLPLLGLLLMTKKTKIRLLQRFLTQYGLFAKLTMTPYFYEDRFYMDCTKTLQKFISTFLITIGVDKLISQESAEIFSMFIEYDTAYRFRMEDVMSETSKEVLLENPAKEIARLFKLSASREESSHVTKSFNSIALLLRLAFWIPWIKRAFITALESIDVMSLQLDEADRFHVSRLGGYKFFGEELEYRLEKYPRIDPEKAWTLNQVNPAVS